jgi:hypothetical protein
MIKKVKAKKKKKNNGAKTFLYLSLSFLLLLLLLRFIMELFKQVLLEFDLLLCEQVLDLFSLPI